VKAEPGLADPQRLPGWLTLSAVPARSRYAPDPVIAATVHGPAVTITAGATAITGRVTTSGGTSPDTQRRTW